MRYFKEVRLFSCIIAVFIILFTGIVSVQAATITVAAVNTDTRNTNGSCSLREAITNINNGATTYADCPPTGAYGTSDTINIPAGTYTIALAGLEDSNATGDFDIRKSVAIVGAGSSSTTINGGALDGVFHITGVYTVTISGVTITGGNTAVISGGGIQNWGTLTVTNSTISGNTATTGNAGGIHNVGGGTLTVTNSTITSNTASDNGGGILNAIGTLTVTNSTISGNSASSGGGIENWGTATVTNSTIVRNIAPAGRGGGYNQVGTGTFTNSIVADNGVGLDCLGAITDSGGNIDSDGSCGTFTQNAAMIQGTGFGALASNGGPTQTHALLAGSAAIDTGNPAVCAAAPVSGLDQIGTIRPQGSVCDIGAYEYVAPVITAPVSVPTMNEWGMMIFMLLAGLGSMYYMRRRA